MRHAHPLPPLALLLALLGLAACGEDGQSPTAPTAPAERGGPVFSHVAGHVVVNSLADPGNGICDATQCTLREAIKAAGSARISFKPGLTGTITLARPGLGGGTLVIDKSLTITGPSVGITIQRRSTDPAFRIVRIAAGDTVRLTNLTLRNGKTDGTGGGIINFGRLALTSSLVAGNSASFLGGGIDNHGLLALSSSRVANNSGGGISNEGNLTIGKSLITGNRGTGIRNQGRFTLAHSLVADNSRGGISNDGLYFRDISGVITNSTIARNSIDGHGGGIANALGATLTIMKSTIAGNTASQDGGGIYNRQGVRDGRGQITIRNSTVSANSAGRGGGIYSVGDGATFISTLVTIANSTIARNSAASGGGIYQDYETSLELTNSLIGQNSAATGPDLFGTGDTFARFNLIGDGSASGVSDGADGNHVGTASAPIDPRLAPLASYGGPTKTHRLLLGSPAIDAASSTDCPATDQRGVGRPQGAACDIGSFERVQP